MVSEKQAAHAVLQNLQAEIYNLGETLFHIPELGFQEFGTAQAITEYLAQAGIAYESEIAVTGIKATVGKGDYHIALVTDLDAVAVSSNGEMIPFHSCGHSSQNTIMLAVLKTLQQTGVCDKYNCRVSYFGTPAEEYIELDYRQTLIDAGKIRYYSGKQNMLSQGYFDDVDCVLSCHIMGDSSKKFDYYSSLSGFKAKKVVFKGVASHAGSLPFLGRNALHGATLFIQALAMLNEQYPPEAGVQIHPIVTNGGITMNTIPDTAVVESYIRANTTEHLFDAEAKFDNAARHCAEALGLTCELESTVGYLPLKQSGEINRLVHQNILQVCGEEDILAHTVSGASGDMGDISFLMPTIQLGYSGYEGRIHSNQFEIVDKYLNYMAPAQVLLDTVLDLAENPDLRVTKTDYAEKMKFYKNEWLNKK